MKWKSLNKVKPSDDKTILWRNERFKSSNPILCYYSKEEDAIYSLNGDCWYPIEITHWIDIPEFETS